MPVDTQDEVSSQAPARPIDPPAPLDRLPQLLRTAGGAILLASVSLFLFRGWQGVNDVHRYGLLLIETAGLAGLGLATGHLLREGKGARLLLTLALASVPANFAILGGLLFSQIGAATEAADYPAAFTWAAASPLAAIGVTLIGAAVCTPIAALAYRVLARHSWRPLSTAFLAGNLALLLPLRTPATIGLAALALCMLALARVAEAARVDRTLKSGDGTIARLLVFAPIATLVGRNLWLYSADDMLILCLALMAFVLLRYLAADALLPQGLRRAAELVSIAPAACAAFAAAELLGRVPAPFTGLVLPVAGGLYFALMTDLGLRACAGRALYRVLAAFGLAVALLANVALLEGALATALCVAGGAAMLIAGTLGEQRSAFLAGIACTVFGVADQIVRIAAMFDLGGWGTLALAGAGAVLLGSVIERRGDALRIHFRQWHQRYEAWEA